MGDSRKNLHMIGDGSSIPKEEEVFSGVDPDDPYFQFAKPEELDKASRITEEVPGEDESSDSDVSRQNIAEELLIRTNALSWLKDQLRKCQQHHSWETLSETGAASDPGDALNI